MPINIRSILSGEINAIDIDFTLDFPLDYTPPGISISEPITVRGTITNQAGYIRINSEAAVKYTAECARCLYPIKSEIKTLFVKTIAVAGTLEQEEDEDDEYVLAYDGFLDIKELVSEQIAIELPSRVFCSDDCPGLCPICGKNLKNGDCGCKDDDIDPRLEPLKKLLEQ